MATALRTIVVLLFSWICYFKALFAALTSILAKIGIEGVESNLATAIRTGVVSVVVPIDKLSVIITVVFSYFVFKEKLSRKAFAGLTLMVTGTLAMTIWA